jgi:para-nitrobenzyl esterase
MTTRREFLSQTVAIAALSGGRAWGASPVASTRHGPVRGFMNGHIHVFKGIRYGADTAPTRFRPPRLPAAWSQPLDTLEYGAACPQTGAKEATSEDCLFLNVWTPGTDRGARPVMFYIHGGAYNHGSGSSPLYDGAALCRRGDVVVVTVNHRLNAFGYAYLKGVALEGFEDSGNVGQLDLVLALQWVRDNIAAFGGDPGRVMVFGQSGGGAKIATMMAMPAADGLFHAAATMSGQQVTASGPNNALARTRAWQQALGLAGDDLDGLLQSPVEKLLDGMAVTDPVLGHGSVYFGPVLDMRSLTRHPFWPDAPEQSKSIPMIIGNTLDETRGFLRDPMYHQLQWDDLPGLLPAQLRVDIDPDYVVLEYRKLYPQWSPSEVFFAATTAGRSWPGAVIEADARGVQGNVTWAYHLNFRSPVQPEMGAPHTMDIPLVFGNLDAPGSITGTGEAATRVSAQMAGAFISLATEGNPNHENLPVWRNYRLPERETMVFDITTRLEADPRGAEREIFARVPYIQPGT